MRAGISMMVVALAVAGCGGDSDGGGGGGASVFANGVAVKGPVADADVEVSALRPTGTLGALLGTGASDANGAFAVAIASHQGWAAVRVTGGTFDDEATGAPAA